MLPEKKVTRPAHEDKRKPVEINGDKQPIGHIFP
jgi:hypothetical protein